MTQILFFINSLRSGGAERILVNLANNLDKDKYDVTVLTLFDKGINRQFLATHIKHKSIFKRRVYGVKQLFKLLSPKLLHKMLIKDKYDIEIAYLQGITTRIVSSSPVPNVAWIHGTFNKRFHSKSYRSVKEMTECYNKYNYVATVSEMVAKSFKNAIPSANKVGVIYNTHDTANILLKAKDECDVMFNNNEVNLLTAGSFLKVKGYSRLLNCARKLKADGLKFHLYFIGAGEEDANLRKQVDECQLNDVVTFLGFQKNPYKYMGKADVFVCSSFSEGFSGTVSEATILGIPTLTTRVSGMNEILGDNNEYGIIVENSDDGLYEGLKDILSHPEKLTFYKEKVKERSSFFSTETTVKAVEDLIDSLVKK